MAKKPKPVQEDTLPSDLTLGGDKLSTGALVAQVIAQQDTDIPPLPPELITKLDHERHDANVCLASHDLRAATAASRAYAQRRLLAMTPHALDNLDRLVDTPDPKTRLSAISRVLDASAATRVDATSPLSAAGDSLPAAAVTAIFEGLRPFVEALASARSPEPSSNADLGNLSDLGALRATYTIEESTDAL